MIASAQPKAHAHAHVRAHARARALTPAGVAEFDRWYDIACDGALVARHAEAFAAALASAETRARERTVDVTTFERRAAELIARADARLFRQDQPGLRFLIDPCAQRFPSSYHGAPQSTQAILRRTTRSWQLSAPFRAWRGRSVVKIDADIDDLGERLAAKFRVTATWM